MRRSNAGNPRCLLRGIRRDRRGSILIETAILLPILLTLLAGAIELSRLLLAQQKVSGLSAQTADMVAQAEFGLSESQVNDIFAAIEHVSQPLNLEAVGRVIVSGVIGTGGGDNEIVWQRCTGVHDADSDIGNEGATGVSVPGGITLAQNEMAVVAEVTMTYEPLIFAGFFEELDLTSDATFRPRFGALSTLSADDTPATC